MEKKDVSCSVSGQQEAEPSQIGVGGGSGPSVAAFYLASVLVTFWQ